MRSRLFALTVVLALLTTPGCWSAKQLSDLAFVLGSAIDVSQEGYTVTIYALSEHAQAGDGNATGRPQDARQPFWLSSATGASLGEAIRRHISVVPRRLFWGHNRVILFGEELARSGVAQALDGLIRYQGLRLSSYVALSAGDPSDVMGAAVALESHMPFAVHRLATAPEAVDWPLWPDLSDLSTTLALGGHPVIPVIGTGQQGTLEVLGIGVFRNDRLAQILSLDEARGLLWLQASIGQRLLDLEPGPEHQIASLEIFGGTSRMRITPDSDGRLVCRYEIKVTGLLDEWSHFGAEITTELLREVEKRASDTIRRETLSLLLWAQELGIDISGVAEAVRRKHPRLWRGLAADWQEAFSDLRFEVDASAVVTQSGMLIGSRAGR